MPTLYRRRPSLIEALQWDGTNADEVINFIGLHGKQVKDEFVVTTNHGHAVVAIGDFIIRSQFGEFYPCSIRELEANYEPVSHPLGRQEV